MNEKEEKKAPLTRPWPFGSVPVKGKETDRRNKWRSLMLSLCVHCAAWHRSKVATAEEVGQSGFGGGRKTAMFHTMNRLRTA